MDNLIKNYNENVNYNNNNYLLLLKNFDDKLSNVSEVTNNLKLEDQIKIIKNNNIRVLSKLEKELREIDTIKIVAKGPNSCYVEEGHGINQAVKLTNKKFLYMNDIHSFYGIEDILCDVSYIFMPTFPHTLPNFQPSIFVSYIKIIEYLKEVNFKGEIFFYEIQTTPFNLLSEFSFISKTTTDIPIILYSRYLNKNKFELYGFTDPYNTNTKSLHELGEFMNDIKKNIYLEDGKNKENIYPKGTNPYYYHHLLKLNINRNQKFIKFFDYTFKLEDCIGIIEKFGDYTKQNIENHKEETLKNIPWFNYINNADKIEITINKIIRKSIKNIMNNKKLKITNIDKLFAFILHFQN